MAQLLKVWSVTGTGGFVSHRYWRFRQSHGPVMEDFVSCRYWWLVSYRYWRFGQSQVLAVSSVIGTGGFVSHKYWRIRQAQVFSSVTDVFISHRWFRQSQVLSVSSVTDRYWRFSSVTGTGVSLVTGIFVSHRYWRFRQS